MASAIPYDPDDFENNNPFAEPESVPAGPVPDHVPPVNDVLDPPPDESEQDTSLNGLSHSKYHETYNTTAAADTSEAAPEASTQNTNPEGVFTKQELMRLVPERFNHKYHIRLKLRSIENSKSENPILSFDAEVAGLAKYRHQHYKNVRRTYSEVLRFNKYLLVSNLEVFVPVIPSPITSYPTGGEDETKQLMAVWQEWMDRVCGNPILARDEEFVFFIENDFGYAVINAGRKALVALGFVRKTLKQLAVPYDAYQELAEFRPLVKAAYVVCRKLHKALDKNLKHERHYLTLVAELSTKLKGLAQFETLYPGMKNMWEKLAQIAHIQLELALIRLVSDMGLLGDGLQAMADDLYEIKEALTNRHLIMREHIQAQANTRAKHAHATKIKSRMSLDPIKVDEALSALEQAQKVEESLDLQVKRISGEMLFGRTEALDFVDKKFRAMCKQYALSRVDQHRRLLKSLENIRFDVRVVDANGGLSRLNRENLAQMKHNLTQSQAAGGDSWTSRTFRSLTTEQAHKQQKDPEAVEVDARQAALVLGIATF